MNAHQEAFLKLIYDKIQQKMSDVYEIREELKFQQKTMLKAKNHVENQAATVRSTEGKIGREIDGLRKAWENNLNVFKISFALEGALEQDQRERYIHQRYEYIDKIKAQILRDQALHDQSQNESQI